MMTGEEIVRALKYCISDGYFCEDCPFEDRLYESEYNCTHRILCAAYDLINRQRIEIEGLKHNSIKEFIKILKKSDKFYDCIRAIGNVDKIDMVINCIDEILEKVIGENA